MTQEVKKKRGSGSPKGSKNKPKTTVSAADKPKKRGHGRPKGSKNKKQEPTPATQASTAAPKKKPGRPKGSKNSTEVPKIGEYDPNLWAHCVKCRTVYRSNNKIGHCGACCRTFSGLGAFDAHRQGNHGPERHCADPATHPEKEKWWTDQLGIWHKGDRFDSETLAGFLKQVKAEK
ncbi:hypothetical protein [Nesterenkonia alba]|uniref:FDXHR family putative zinc-binding protein n=1 Tax=Nesterenkonia alba TaxID=515814 RepID=UPI0012EBDFEC|nr:hypothetical protein [Nesterenkonia alba]